MSRVSPSPRSRNKIVRTVGADVSQGVRGANDLAQRDENEQRPRAGRHFQSANSRGVQIRVCTPATAVAFFVYDETRSVRRRPLCDDDYVTYAPTRKRAVVGRYRRRAPDARWRRRRQRDVPGAVCPGSGAQRDTESKRAEHVDGTETAPSSRQSTGRRENENRGENAPRHFPPKVLSRRVRRPRAKVIVEVLRTRLVTRHTCGAAAAAARFAFGRPWSLVG